MSTRGTWFMRDRPVVIWLIAALLVSLVHPFFAYSRWLMVHLVVLGAVTHAAMVWSVHFTEALLKTRADFEPRRIQTIRLGVFQAGVLLVLVGVPSELSVLTMIGGTLVSGAVLWHAVMLVRRLKAALPGRFRITVRYYVVAALMLPVGATFGILLASGHDHAAAGADATHAQLLVAHTMVNLLGWIGLTILGTLVTLWPTMLRTRMADSAESASRHALPVLVGGLALVVTSPFIDLPVVGAIGIGLYLAGALWVYRPILTAARQRPPYAFPTLSVGAGLLWLPVGLLLMAWSLGARGSWEAIADNYGALTTIFVVGFALQVLLGALSYLLPVVIGGGPSVVRAGMAELERWSTARVAVANLGLAICLLPVPSLVRVVVSVLTLAALATSIPLVFRGIRASVRAKRAKDSGGDPGAPAVGAPLSKDEVAARTAESQSQSWSRPQLIAGVTIIAVGATLGVGLDPSAAGLTMASGTAPAAAQVSPTGETTTVKVTMKDMRFTPDSVDVPVGNRLVIELVNADPGDVHDLVLASGERSGRVSPGGTGRLEIDVVRASSDGWCSVVGHRQMGMLFTVNAIGAEPTAGSDAQGEGSTGTSGTTAHGSTGHGTPGGSGASPAIDFMAKWGGSSAAYDPVLPPLTDEKVRRITLTVREVKLEVAPGVTQTRWTYNGSSIAPTLHGRVGDTFEVTLVNQGSMGHSIDFHASELAPEGPMRTIQPGESLVYRFTAKRSGIWMYHCGTMPMTSHIAAGMAGAVIIEPEGLPEVDRSYVLAQSEIYLGAQGDPVNADKVAAEQPDAVVFNGHANQYVDHPLEARVGERVRIWVLDIGPNRPTSFHVVGGQFDTVYKEGTYLLKNGRGALDPPGTTTGGSQALDLAAAQGGFVELGFPEPGRYPLVSHIMVDAERGARGFIAVSE
ncbi:multicopper oxidase domain-containing protein [Intrasporangium calvum]|uniref:Copper-containing nitrite reductase n=1 Tax=Intrasporangium calvum TaxID=53358 RepID=A0ABT5GE30_9MICO|nr:multicopper oxidase domain-containing protein [Intrasporangium calvum]MDC5696070.1 multicopper oxidase domain-containing protein [Intrasporangium calvum]